MIDKPVGSFTLRKYLPHLLTRHQGSVSALGVRGVLNALFVGVLVCGVVICSAGIPSFAMSKCSVLFVNQFISMVKNEQLLKQS